MHLLTKSFEEKGVIEEVVDNKSRYSSCTATTTTLLKHQNVKGTLFTNVITSSLIQSHDWSTYILVNIKKGSMFGSWNLGQCIRAIFDNRKSPPTRLWSTTRTQSVVAYCILQQKDLLIGSHQQIRISIKVIVAYASNISTSYFYDPTNTLTRLNRNRQLPLEWHVHCLDRFTGWNVFLQIKHNIVLYSRSVTKHINQS